MEIPKGHYVFGTVKVGERGQIVIPKEARQVFDIKAGDTLIVLGDEKWGIAVTKADVLEKYAVDLAKIIHMYMLTTSRFFCIVLLKGGKCLCYIACVFDKH